MDTSIILKPCGKLAVKSMRVAPLSNSGPGRAKGIAGTGLAARSLREFGYMHKALLGLLIAVIVIIGGAVAVLAAWDLPAPSAQMEVQIPNDRLSLQ